MGGFALVANEDGSIVGTILLKPLPTSGLIEVGWHIALDCWGRGYATESGKAAITYGFNKLGLDRIYAVIDPLNHRSAEVARRCEMALQGKIFEYDLDLDLYSIDRGV